MAQWVRPLLAIPTSLNSVLVCVVATCLLIQLLDNLFGKAVEDGSCDCVPVTIIRDQNGV